MAALEALRACFLPGCLRFLAGKKFRADGGSGSIAARAGIFGGRGEGYRLRDKIPARMHAGPPRMCARPSLGRISPEMRMKSRTEIAPKPAKGGGGKTPRARVCATPERKMYPHPPVAQRARRITNRGGVCCAAASTGPMNARAKRIKKSIAPPPFCVSNLDMKITLSDALPLPAGAPVGSVIIPDSPAGPPCVHAVFYMAAP